MKTLVFIVSISILFCGIEANDNDKDLIIGGVNIKSTTPPPEDTTKFKDVLNQGTLRTAIDNLRTNEFERLQKSIKDVKDRQHEQSTKTQLEDFVTTLNKARDGETITPVRVMGIKEVKTCVVLLGAKAISLENEIPHNKWMSMIDEINTLEKEIHDEFDHLLKLIHFMDCKLKTTCFNDLVISSKQTIHDEIQKVGNLDDMCHEFNHVCAKKFTEAKMRFSDFMTNNIEKLRHQLKEIVHLDCLAHKSQKKVFANRIDQLEQHALNWIHDLTVNLKALVELEIDTLSSRFKQTCNNVNEQKLKFKDNRGTLGEIAELAIITTDLTTLSETASTITEEFLIAYNVLLHLKGIVEEKEFNACYDKASELYYLVQGFKLQIEECIATVKKRETIAVFEDEVKDFIGARVNPSDAATATQFTSAKQAFVNNLKSLKEVGLTGMCKDPNPGPETYALSFGALFDVDYMDFKRLLGVLDIIRTTKLPKLMDCPEFAEKTAQLTALRNDVIKYQKNAEQQKCFGNVFHVRFC